MRNKCCKQTTIGGWGSMSAGDFQEYEQKIKRLRDRAAEVRILAADMRHHESRASLLQMAAIYDELASLLSRVASPPISPLPDEAPSAGEN